MRSIRSLFLLLLFFFLGCKSSQNSTLHSGNVAYVSNEGLETLTLRSTDYGTNKEDAIENAKRLAFQNLFFRGVPNSPYRDPILGISETEKYREHEDYLKEFYDNRMYTFINRSSELISQKAGNTGYCKSYYQYAGFKERPTGKQYDAKIRIMKTLNALTTVAIYCCCLVWGSFSQIRAQQRGKKINPSIMVLPRTTEGEDLRTIMDEQPAVRVGISSIKQYLDDRDYTSLDFETLLKATIRDEAITRENQSDFKDRIFRNIPSDIIIEIDMMEQESGSGNMVRLILEANVTDNGQSMGSLICESNRFYTEDIGALTDAALKSKTDNNIVVLISFSRI